MTAVSKGVTCVIGIPEEERKRRNIGINND